MVSEKKINWPAAKPTRFCRPGIRCSRGKNGKFRKNGKKRYRVFTTKSRNQVSSPSAMRASLDISPNSCSYRSTPNMSEFLQPTQSCAEPRRELCVCAGFFCFGTQSWTCDACSMTTDFGGNFIPLFQKTPKSAEMYRTHSK